jgi:demethylmenaquinone methyltransferase/2-methoxy-6-polyprenyl-1,4-benzoquinol methylase
MPSPQAVPDSLARDPLARADAAARGEDKHAYVQRMFADIAPRYDLLNRVLSLRIDVAWRRAALRALGWDQVPAGRYLDLCAGTLDVGAALVARPGFAGTVAGADFAIPMLRHGTGKAPASRLAPVGADALALPFADAAFDGAIVAFGIRNVARLDDALREVRRTLRPGARFVILEFSTPPNALVRAAYHAYFHRVLPLVGRLVSGHASAYAYLPRSVAHFPAEDALAARLRDAGFRDVHWRRLTLGVAALHVAVA